MQADRWSDTRTVWSDRPLGSSPGGWLRAAPSLTRPVGRCAPIFFDQQPRRENGTIPEGLQGPRSASIRSRWWRRVRRLRRIGTTETSIEPCTEEPRRGHSRPCADTDPPRARARIGIQSHRLAALPQRAPGTDSNPCSNPPTVGPVRGRSAHRTHRVTSTDGRQRTPADVVPMPDTEEVTGSIPVSPTMFVQVRGRFGFARSGRSAPRTPTRTPTALLAGVGGRARMGSTVLAGAPPPHCPRRSTAREREEPADDDPLPVSPHGRGHGRRGRASRQWRPTRQARASTSGPVGAPRPT